MNWDGYALVGVLLALVISAPVVYSRVRLLRLSRAGLDDLNEMTDDDMLLHMARLFGALGYRVFRPLQQDCGFDLILVDGLAQRRGVVVHHWRQLVDDAMINAVAAAAAKLDLSAPMVVSVAGYTYKGREAAAKDGIILWALAELTDAIGRVKQSAIAYPDLPSISTLTWKTEAAARAAVTALGQEHREPAPDREAVSLDPRRRRRPERHHAGERWEPDAIPRCPRCGRKMVVRRGAEGDYWGCPMFPRCLGTRPRS